jgi:hypothetical protein
MRCEWVKRRILQLVKDKAEILKPSKNKVAHDREVMMNLTNILDDKWQKGTDSIKPVSEKTTEQLWQCESDTPYAEDIVALPNYELVAFIEKEIASKDEKQKKGFQLPAGFQINE